MKKLSSVLAIFMLIQISALAEVVKVDSAALNRGLYDSPEHLIEGIVPGVNVSSPDGNVATSLDVILRGRNSAFSSLSEPLWIVDGVELSNPFGQQIPGYWLDKYAAYSYMNPLSHLDFINLYDIESIRVIKDISEASAYGPKSANGVIVITTKNASTDKPLFDWSSNFGYDRGFRHNHNLAFSQNIANSSLRVSAFYKDHTVSANGSLSRFGGLRTKYDSRNYKYVWFGLNFNMAVGRQASCMTTDKDDYANSFRVNGNLYLQINFLPCLKWRTDMSVDSNNSSRYLWDDLGTEIGKLYNRTSALAVSNLFDSKVTTKLMFDRFFGSSHHLYADASFDYRVDNCSFDNMDGEGFFTDALRAKGFNLKESSFPTYRVSKQQQILGIAGTLKYDFKGFAGISASIATEKNNIYDDGFLLYPSAEAFLDIRKAFFPSSSAVSSLQISGGWGKAPMSRYSPWRLIGNYVAMDYAKGKLTQKGIEIDENDPKKNIASNFDVFDRVVSSEYHIGGNLGFLKGRIGLSAEYYSKKSDESLFLYCFAAKTDTYIWKSAPRSEIFNENAEVFNKGVELSLTGRAVDSKNIYLDLRLSGAYNENSLLSDPTCSGYFGARLVAGGFSADVSLDGAVGHYVRMPKLEAAYHFDMKKVSWIKGLDVSISGSNLFTVCKDAALPVFRSVVLGIGAKF